MTVVAITGSTRGIGFHLAKAFLERGCKVAVSGRTERAVADAVDQLAKERGELRASLAGVACDVTDGAAVDALLTATEARLGPVDIWINNAGTCNRIRPIEELSAAELGQVVDINVKGNMHGTLTALRAMRPRGRGQIFSMEGWGSRGETSPGMTPYCMTKRALRYFADSLAKELRGTGVRVGTVSPGMVVTDLLVDSYADGLPAYWQKKKWLFHFVVDPPEPVCAFLASRILANRRANAHIAWMTPLRLLSRFFRPSYYRRNPFAGSALDTL
ncbi:MAG: SDR family oxidoreductase [Polyangiaceae bacterium]